MMPCIGVRISCDILARNSDDRGVLLGNLPVGDIGIGPHNPAVRHRNAAYFQYLTAWPASFVLLGHLHNAASGDRLPDFLWRLGKFAPLFLVVSHGVEQRPGGQQLFRKVEQGSSARIPGPDAPIRRNQQNSLVHVSQRHFQHAGLGGKCGLAAPQGISRQTKRTGVLGQPMELDAQQKKDGGQDRDQQG
jgi:hypothetical protein